MNPADTKVTCKFCHRVRTRPKMERAENGSWRCRDEVGCSVAAQWAEGGGDGR